MTPPSATPVSGPLDRALDHLVNRAWRQAREVVQPDTSTLAAWRHGIGDIRERELDNARGEDERVERGFPGTRRVEEKLVAARRALGARTR